MGRTITEKIFSAHLERDVRAGEIVVAPVDFVYSHDGNRPQTSEIMVELGGTRVFDPAKYAAFQDHAPASHLSSAVDRQALIKRFAEEQGTRLYPLGSGINHQVLTEEGHAVPGRIIVGADSHTVTAGAFNCLATGMGYTDVAATMMLGKAWFKVPETIRVQCDGALPEGVHSKDLVLHLIKTIGQDGANYRTLEYVGPAVSDMSMQARMTMTNMAIEMGAKFGLMEADEVTRCFLDAIGVTEYETYVSDPDATFVERYQVDVSSLEPMVACPPSPDQVASVESVAGTTIHQATIGTCANSQIEDLRIAASVLRGRSVHPNVRLFVTAATKRAYEAALREGIIELFVGAGARIGTPGCTGCTGATQFGIPGDNENQITSANRNFTGRTGNAKANIYLGSPATVMASAIEGRIADPRAYL